MISRFLEEKNKTLMLLGWTSAVLYLCLSLILTIFSDSTHRPEATMFILWAVYLCYIFGWRVVKDNSKKTIIPIIFFTILFYSLMFFVVPPTESDFYHYYFEDHIWSLEHLNPYYFSPNILNNNWVSQFTHWPTLAAQHGPIRSLVMAPAAWLGGGIFWTSLFWYKIIFLLFISLLFFACYKVSFLIGRKDSAQVLLLLCWNPLILYESMTASGTDIIMMAFFALSILFLFNKKFISSAIFLSASVMTKYVTILSAPFIFWYVYKKGSLKIFPKYLFTFLLTSFIYFLPFWFGLKTLDSLFYIASYFESNSLIGLTYVYLGFFGFSISSLLWQQITNLLFLTSYLLTSILFVLKNNLTNKKLIVFCVLAFSLFLSIAKIWFYVKYLIWIIPLLIILDKKLDWVTVFLTGLSVFGLVFTPVFTLLLIPSVITLGGYFVAKNHFKLA